MAAEIVGESTDACQSRSPPRDRQATRTSAAAAEECARVLQLIADRIKTNTCDNGKELAAQAKIATDPNMCFPQSSLQPEVAIVTRGGIVRAKFGRNHFLGTAAMASAVTCGVVLYETPSRDLRRLAISAVTACTTAGVSCRLMAIDNSDSMNAASFSMATCNTLPSELLPSEGNLGFGGGHNRLMTLAFADGASHYLTLNPDGFLHPEALRALLEQSSRRDDFALIEARQFPNEHPKIYDTKTLETPWCSGACLMISRRLHDAIGGFDDGFFMYCEDVDYSWRARLAGAACVIAADAFFFHDVLDRQSDFVRWHMALSMKRLLSKWKPGVAPPGLLKSLTKMLCDAPKEVTRRGSAPCTPLNDPRCIEVADFDYSFGFAPFRWT